MAGSTYWTHELGWFVAPLKEVEVQLLKGNYVTLTESLIKIDGNNTGRKHETYLNSYVIGQEFYRAGHKGAFSNRYRNINMLYAC